MFEAFLLEAQLLLRVAAGDFGSGRMGQRPCRRRITDPFYSCWTPMMLRRSCHGDTTTGRSSASSNLSVHLVFVLVCFARYSPPNGGNAVPIGHRFQVPKL